MVFVSIRLLHVCLKQTDSNKSSACRFYFILFFNFSESLLLYGKIQIKDTSVVPPLIYAVMGTSREIAIGPVAVVSLLLSSMIQNIVDPATDPVAYRSLVFTVTFLAGVFQVSFGLFRCVPRSEPFTCKYALFLH